MLAPSDRLIIPGAVLVALGVLYQLKPNLFRRWFWTKTSIMQRLLSPTAYERYIKSLGLLYILLGILLTSYGLLRSR